MPEVPSIILRVAVPSPLRRHFDYRLPGRDVPPTRGSRVRVPFGRRTLVGLVLGQADASEVPAERLKPIDTGIDATPLLSEELLSLIEWAADYYHHPIGDALQTALPVTLRRGLAATPRGEEWIQLTPLGRDCPPGALARAPRQRAVLGLLAAAPAAGLSMAALIEQLPQARTALRSLAAKGRVQIDLHEPMLVETSSARPGPALTAAQEQARTEIVAAVGGFQGFLVHGITGSGKTEVYLRAVDAVVAAGGQALVLVPEIGLTPQLIQRFRERFSAPLVVMHSGLNESERHNAWLAARDGRASIVLGTRSAVFAPLPRLQLIIVDEEHDSSYKQQDGFRYSARDVAVMRAHRAGAVVVLGSATPSLESLYNAINGRYRMLALPERATRANLPAVHLLDMRRLAVHDGLSPPLIEAVARRLAAGEQSLIFLNRRGFAPVLMCHECGWLAPCKRCDARLTVHRRRQCLHCHHCGAEVPIPTACPACGSVRLFGLGEGTERIEDALVRHFPQARIERIDRDSTRRKGALEAKLQRAHAGEADILVGTQMLAKGHDLPNVTLVGVINADQGLYSVDFRADEQLMQRIVQVAGRAGRADKPGEVLIQTYHPDHPLFAALRHHDYMAFAEYALEERRQAQYPPLAPLALLRAESTQAEEPLTFLAQAREFSATLDTEGVTLADPVASPMERRAGRYRAQLMLQAANRGTLHRFLEHWLPLVETAPLARKVRWSLDVDPVDLY